MTGALRFIIMKRLSLLLAALLLGTSISASATPHRGVWFWNTTEVGGSDSPHSAAFVVGPTSGPAEDEAIAFMTAQDIKEVYGSYKHRPSDVPGEIWPWNAKLDAAGIDSQLLISGFEAPSPGPLTDPDHLSLVTKVTERLIDFNDAAPSPASRFDALHLDLEPQKLNLWSSGSATDKRAFLDDLLDAYIDIRAALDAGGYGALPIYADIPFTWDKIPGSIGWADPADRDTWFSNVLAVVDGLTIMTFSKDNFADLETATDYERTMGGANVHVAIQPKVGPSQIWPTYPSFESTMIALETNHGEAHIENYAFWRHAYEDFGPTIGSTLPGLDALPELVNNGSGSGGVIILTGAPGYLYTIKHSTHPNTGWVDIVRTTTRSSQEKEVIEWPVDYGDDERGFWKVTEEPADNELPAGR